VKLQPIEKKVPFYLNFKKLNTISSKFSKKLLKKIEFSTKDY